MLRPLNSGTQITSRQRGFSLTELAIVMGIVGIVLASIWTATAIVTMNNNTRSAISDLGIISEGYRELFQLHGIDVGTSTTDTTWHDITCQGVTNGYFPAPMIPGACTAGTASTYPVGPYGGSNVSVFAYEASQGIIIQLSGLTPSQCNAYANQAVGIQGLIWVGINTDTSGGTWLPPAGTGTPPKASVIADATHCATNSNNTNYVAIMYPAR